MKRIVNIIVLLLLLQSQMWAQEMESSEPVSVSICEGEQITLSAEQGIAYEWSTGANVQAIPVNPLENTTYSVTVSKENGCLSVATIEVVIKPIVDIEIIAEGDVCNFPVVLTAPEGYTYTWRTEGGVIETIEGNSHQINALEGGTYYASVTADNEVCEVEASLSLEESSTSDIQNKLEELGFYKVPITLIGQAFSSSGSRSRNDCSASDDIANFDCSGVDCQYADNDQAFMLNGETVSDLSNQINTNLQTISEKLPCLSSDDSAPFSSFITNNDFFCCENYCEQILEKFNAQELAYWAHLWEDPNGEQDYLYVLANVPNGESNLPGSNTELTSFLDEQLATQTTAEEAIFTIQSVLLNDLQSYENPSSSSSTPSNSDCFALQEDVVVIAPSGRPIPLPAGSRLEYYPQAGTQGNFDTRAIAGFTTPDGKRYNSFFNKCDPSMEHLGFRDVTDPTFTAYMFPMLDVKIGDKIQVILGEVGNSKTCQTDYVIAEFQWTIDKAFTPTSEGPLVADFTKQIEAYYHTAFQACLPNMNEDAFANAQEVAKLNPFGEDGFIFKIQNGTQKGFVYGFPGEGETIHYLIWDAALCRWRSYDGVQEAHPEMHFLTALLLTAIESGHITLDIAGTVPVIGELADIINGVWYLAKGDNGNAIISFASTIPLIVANTNLGTFLNEVGEQIISIVRRGLDGKPINFIVNGKTTVNALDVVRDLTKKSDLGDVDASALANYLTKEENKDLLILFHQRPELVGAWQNLYKREGVCPINPLVTGEFASSRSRCLDVSDLFRAVKEGGDDFFNAFLGATVKNLEEWDGDKLYELLDDVNKVDGLFDAMKANPKLLEAWGVIYGKPERRLELDILEDVAYILNSPTNYISRNILENIVNTQKAIANASTPDFGELMKNIRFAEMYVDVPGFDKVLSDLQLHGFGEQIGANWVLEFLRKHDNLDPSKMRFEYNVNSDGSRYVDVFFKENGIDVFYEFKSVKSLPPSRFAEQFVKDLENVDDLEQIKWIFDGNKLDANSVDLLGSKDEFVENLLNSDAFNNNEFLAKFLSLVNKKYFSEAGDIPLSNYSQLSMFLENNDDWFSLIFMRKP